MKIKLLVLLILAVSLSFAAGCSLTVPEVSCANPSLNFSLGTGHSAQDPMVTRNSRNNVTISGNLMISGNSVVDFAGVSSSVPVQVYLNGSIYVNDNATLILRYAVLNFIGATKPYSRNITLSSPNGHPTLNITSSVINAYTVASQVYRRVGTRNFTTSASYGVAIYAYNESKIIAQQLDFYREMVYSNNFNLGGPTEIECYGKSSANLISVKVDAVSTYDQASVTVYTGTGHIAGSGILLACYNSSAVNLNGVTLANTTATDNAHLVLTHCQEVLAGSVITATGTSRVDCLEGTRAMGRNGVPGINASGYSYVSLSSSTAAADSYDDPAVSVYDHATFAVVGNGIISSGAIFAFDSSNVVLNNTTSLAGLINMEVIGNNSSSISISNCSFWSNPFPVTMSLSGSSRLSLAKSSITGGWITFSNDSAVCISGSTMSGSRILAQDNTNLTVAGGSNIADSIEMNDTTRLGLESSTVSEILCVDSSQASLVKSSVSELVVSDNSTVHSTNSTIGEISLTESNVTGSLSGLTSFLVNSTLSVSGSSSHVSVLNTTINAVDFSFSGSSNVTISNSTLQNLSLQGSSFVTLRNASVYAGPYVTGNSGVLMYSDLRVRCVDYFGNPLNDSLVTVKMGRSLYARELANETTNKNGWASLILFSGITNATGSFPLGIVTVEGNFKGVSTSQDVSVGFASKDVTLSLPLPSWSGYILPLIIFIVVVALLVLLYYVNKRVRRNKM